jgi:hypothetical protein
VTTPPASAEVTACIAAAMTTTLSIGGKANSARGRAEMVVLLRTRWDRGRDRRGGVIPWLLLRKSAAIEIKFAEILGRRRFSE